MNLRQANSAFKKINDQFDIVIPPIEWVAHPYTMEDTENWASSKLKIDEWIDKYESTIRKGKNIIYIVIDTAGTWNFSDMQYAVNQDLCFDATDTGIKDDHGHSHMIGTTTFHKKYGIISRLAEMEKIEVVLIKGLSRGGAQWSWLVDSFKRVELIAKSNPNKQVVVNCSFGATRAYNETMSAIAERTKNENNVIWVGSIGNAGQSQAELGGFPGIDKSFVGVGAVDQNQKAKSYSSKSKHVDATSYSGVPGYDHNGNFGLREGTSFSGPNFAALVSLALLSGHTTPETLFTDIKTKSKDLGPVGFDDVYGYGILDFDTWTSEQTNPEPPQETPEEPPKEPVKTVAIYDVVFDKSDLSLKWIRSGESNVNVFNLKDLKFNMRYPENQKLEEALQNAYSAIVPFFTPKRFFQLPSSYDIRQMAYMVGVFLNFALKESSFDIKVTEIKGGHFNSVFIADIKKPMPKGETNEAVKIIENA